MDSVEQGRNAWGRLRRVGQTAFEDWVLVARALDVGREQSLRLAQTNKPQGKKYTRAMRHWLESNDFGDTNLSERYSCHRLLENLTEITAWRDSLDEHRRRKNNHPHGIYWAWRRSLNLAPPLKKLPSVRPPVSTRRNIYFSQDQIRRAAAALKESWSPDFYILARTVLEAAIRDTADADQLYVPNRPSPKQSAPQPAAALHAPA